MAENREGRIEDLPRVLELIRELAEFERAPDEVTNTVEHMERDGFGPNPLFGFYVAEDGESGIVGLALYYFRYSTWKSKRMYLEDSLVTESFRGRGIGKRLFDQVIRKGVEEECSGMVWQVLDWNEPAIGFYREVYGAALDPEWINCSIERDQMEAHLGS